MSAPLNNHNEASGRSVSKSVTGVERIPTAVTAKPVLKLIRAAIEHDDATVKEAALDIAHELELNNEQELAYWIYAQYKLVRTFEVTD